MAPKITRPRRDRPQWIAAVAFGLASLVVGYWAGAKVFNPGRAAVASDDENGSNGEGPSDDVRNPSAGDGGAVVAGHSAGEADAAVANAVVEEPPRVPVHIARSVIQSCGDGEELNVLGSRCPSVEGLDEALRHHLLRLGSCPTAEPAASNPELTLSIGLRVDFARRRVTALPGRSSSVHNPLTFVPCARTALEHADDLWRLQPPHPRYLYFFSVHFGPMDPSAEHAERPTVQTPIAPATPAPDTESPTGEPPHGTPTASTPTTGHEETVTAVWARVIVRDAPRTGGVVARVPQGTTMTVLSRQSSWYQVRWSAGTGWVYGEAIGRH